MQKLLRQRGFSVAVDGHFGRQTKAAVQRFQSIRHLDADGVVGRLTIEALVKP